MEAAAFAIAFFSSSFVVVRLMAEGREMSFAPPCTRIKCPWLSRYSKSLRIVTADVFRFEHKSETFTNPDFSNASRILSLRRLEFLGSVLSRKTETSFHYVYSNIFLKENILFSLLYLNYLSKSIKLSIETPNREKSKE